MSVKTSSSSILQKVLRVIWHIFRYSTATCISTIMLASVPVLAVCVVSGIILASYALGWLGLLPVDEPLSLVVGPIVLGIIGIVVVIGITLVALGVTLVGILPVSALAEISCRGVSKHIILIRLLGFVVAELLFGIIISVCLLIIPKTAALALSWPLFGGVLIESVGFVLLFGLVLTSLTLIKDGISWLWTYVRKSSAA